MAKAAKPQPKKKRPPKRERGRPPGTGFKPTEAQRKTVKLGATYRIPEDEICVAIINPTSGKPISPVTLRKHFPEELKLGHVDGKMRLMAAQFNSATGIAGKNGKYLLTPNVTAQIWLGKVLLGQRESVVVEPPAPPPGAENSEGEVTLEAARRLAFTLHLGAREATRKAVATKAKKA